jgi:stress response protein YsnF
MITREQIPQVVGHPVYDSEGKKIGDAKHMYLDDATGDPEWVTVKTGFFGNNETFVPTRAARLVQDHVEVPYAKEKVKDAPNVDVDSGGHLSVEEERNLYRYYGMERTGAAAGGKGGMAQAVGGKASEPAGTGTAKGGMSGSEAGAGTGAGYAAGRTAPTERLSQDQVSAEDDAMTRSEEELHVRLERTAAGRARLRKVVDVEEVEQTVPVRHEEIRLEREPITERNRGPALSGPEIAEAEHVVTLHEEKPVIETEVVPKERIRMRVEEHTEERKVRGRVRKERIETDVTAHEADQSQSRKDKRFR